MLRVAWYIFRKEALDLWRDRRALLFLFAMPLLMPLLVIIGGGFIVWQVGRQAREGLPIAVVNGHQLPALVTELEDEALLHMTTVPTDTEEALQSGDLLAVLEIPPDATARIEAEEPLTLTLTSSRSGWLPDVATTSIQDILADYENGILEDRLRGRELNLAWMDPIRLDWEAAATTGVSAAPVGDEGMMPTTLGNIFLTLAITSWVFSGGLSVVSHMTVGEKEHHTMEPLLITPASRVGIVMGKIALSIIVAVITITLWSLDSLAYVSLLSILPTSVNGSSTLFGGFQLVNMGPIIVWMMLLMLPFMTMVNGLLVAVCTFAKDQRESSLFLVAFQLFLSGLTVLVSFGINASPSYGTYALPMVGVLIAMRGLFGGGVAPQALALAWFAAAVYAVLSILLAAYVFSREWALMRGV